MNGLHNGQTNQQWPTKVVNFLHFASGSAFINLHSMKTVSDVLAMLDHSDQVVTNSQFTGPQEVTPLTNNLRGKIKNHSDELVTDQR